MADTKMKDVLSDMAADMAGTWVIIVADNDGMLLSSWSSPENQLPPEMLGGFIQTINATIDAFKQSTASFGQLEDVIFSTGFSYQLIKPIAEGQCFIVVNAPKKVPLGMIRLTVKNYAPRLEQALPGHEPLSNLNGMGMAVH